jgi:hypothetical protein
VAGGGGRGTRPVTGPAGLDDALRRSAAEAAVSFGNSAVYVEELLTSARHIGVQMIGDGSKLVVPQKLGDLGEPGASIAQIRAYFDGLVRDLLSPEGRMGCLLINSAIENAAADPEVAAVMRGHMARIERCFTDALRTAIDLGEIPASVNVTAVAKGLVATASGMMVVGKANPDEEVLRIIVDNAFAGLM